MEFVEIIVVMKERQKKDKPAWMEHMQVIVSVWAVDGIVHYVLSLQSVKKELADRVIDV